MGLSHDSGLREGHLALGRAKLTNVAGIYATSRWTADELMPFVISSFGPRCVGEVSYGTEVVSGVHTDVLSPYIRWSGRGPRPRIYAAYDTRPRTSRMYGKYGPP